MTPKIDQFLTEVNQIIQQGDSEAKDVRDYSSDRLRQYLPIEPKFAEDYNKIIYEMTTFFPKDQEEKLTKKCESLLTKAVDGTWGSFVNFMVGWFAFIKTVNPSNLLETYNSLDDLVQKANLARAHPSLGILMLPTVIAYAEVLCRLAIGLEQQPELIAHLVQTQNTGEGGGEQITLPERAANTLRSAFSTCLTDKSGVKTPLGTDDEGKPAGKKVGIYKIANICLKILFSCNKARNAEQIFANIHQQSPPLAIYPKAQQVTYLYYLGRFHFSTGHFYRAVLTLEHAYGLLPAEPTFAPRQKRLLLIYLISASLICGRFPTAALYARPEAAGLEPAFAGITRAIKTGDVALFRAATSLDAARNPHAPFLLRHRVLLPLRGRADVLVQRALLRAVFVARGSQGDSERRAAPTLELAFFVAAARWLEGRALGIRDGGGVPGVRHTNWSFVERALPKAARYVDPDFEGVEELEVEDDEGYDSTDVGMNVGGDDALGQDDEDGDLLLPDNMDMESVCSSLIDQGFLNGWISRGKSVRVAIKGATQKGNALAVGFPNPWEVIKARMLEEGDDDVPGWKRAVTASAGGFGAPFGPGSVVHLSNARPAGSNPFGG